jgi:hypothetical protein
VAIELNVPQGVDLPQNNTPLLEEKHHGND